MRDGKKLILCAISVAVLLMLTACETKIRQYTRYLCDTDGIIVNELCDVTNSVFELGELESDISGYAIFAQYLDDDNIFWVQNNGVSKYNLDSSSSRWITSSLNLNYSDYCHLQSTATADSFYYFSNRNLYILDRLTDKYMNLVESDLYSCVGLPHSSRMCLMNNDQMTIRLFDGGNAQAATYQLPRKATRAFYFEDADKIVYMADKRNIYTCRPDGSEDSLLYTQSKKVNWSTMMIPIDNAGRFIIPDRNSDGQVMMLLDIRDGSSVVLGPAYNPKVHESRTIPIQISLTRDRSKLLYFNSGAMYKVNLQDMSTEVIALDNVSGITSACIHPEGNRIAFLCEKK
ncbi:MAG TPA: hypothetical protein PLX77_03640 [Candidatus Cloacimonadota bacterium]|nr:hypothetical protein [Candidatus Cloacimonadota bacterium]